MLFGEYEIVEEFLSFICKSCYASFSFAHKIIWFLKSSIRDDPGFDEKIKTVLHIIQTIFKSNNDKKSTECLFLSGSRDYLEYYNETALLKDYFTEGESQRNEEKEYNATLASFHHSKQKFRDSINAHIENEYAMALEKNVTNDNGGISKKNIVFFGEEVINPNEIYLSLFTHYDYVTNDENNISTQSLKQIDLEDINLSSFLSTINFIDQLCNISDRLMYVNPFEQRKVLLNELKQVNGNLPSNVYLPFMNQAMSNYVVCSIPLSEAKIYKTKQRAPYRITIESFKLDELTYNLSNELHVNKSEINEKVRINNGSRSSKLIAVSYDNKLACESKEERFEIVSHLNNQSIFDEINYHQHAKVNEKYKKVNKIGSNLSKPKRRESQSYNKGLVSYLNENAAKYSKPIIIRDIMKNNNITECNRKSNVLFSLMKKKQIAIKTKSKSKTRKEYNKLVENENEFTISNNKDSNNSNIFIKLTNNIHTRNKNNDIDKKFKPIETLFKPYCRSNSINQDMLKKDSLITPQTCFSNRTPKMKSGHLTFLVPMSPNSKSENSKSDEEKEKDNQDVSSREEDNSKTKEKGNIFGETIEQKTTRLKQSSPFGKLVSYKLFDIIIKSGEDLRQEQFASQLINEFHQIFKLSKVKCWLQPYEIIATGHNVGIVEVVPNAVSIDQMKQKNKSMSSLNDIYQYCFGPINSSRYKKAINNYIRSLAGYSLVCYFLQIKDRHNANILIDDQGHLIHIDFGFMLSNAPGKGLKFETAPFKLTQDFVDVMGGTNSVYFDTFRKLLWKGFIASVEHYEKILILIEMMFCGHGNSLPCFINGQVTVDELKKRFIPNQNMKKRDYIEHVDMLISQSLGNWRTKWYDKYQYYVQGILA